MNMHPNSANGLCRIAHVSLGLEMGGMEKLLVEFARHADRERFQLHFICLEGRGKLADEVEALGWPVAALGKRPGVRPGLILKLARLFRRLDVDVVHTHNTAAYFYAVPAARLARVPTVVHTRHGQRCNATPRQNRVFRFLSRFVDTMVCVSEDSRRLARGEGIDPGKTCTIWNGIDLSRFAYTGPTPGGPAVIVARLSPEKDVETLVRAAAIAAERFSGFRLEIVGDGVCRASLEELSAQLRLDDRVRFLGEMDNIPELLGRAALFVLPSLTEGLSLTLLEAMARGLPVVATCVGGNPEVVSQGETGLLVEPRSPESLADAMVRVVVQPELARQMGIAGRRRVEEFFDVRRMIAEYEALYLASELAGRTHRGHSRTRRAI
jgi:glycosyltransferase involved in cell wall biosynthesis